MRDFQLLSIALLVTLFAANSFAAETEEQQQRLEQLQKSLQNAQSDEPIEKLKTKLQILKELLGKEGIAGSERKDLEEKLRILTEQLTPQEKPMLSMEEALAPPAGKRFFIEGNYWLAYIEGGDKEVASLYNIDTKQPIGNAVDTSAGPASAFVASGGYKYRNGNTTLIKLWHLTDSSSLSRSSTSTVGISGTEGSDYYYQNNPWGTTTFATKGVDRVDADSNLDVTNLDFLHAIPIGKGQDKEFGVALGIKYAQADSDYTITYSSTSSALYNIKSEVENTLLGPVFGIYGNGPIYRKLKFIGLLNISIAWDHVKATRLEYDNTVAQTALDKRQTYDNALTVIDGEVGVRYPLRQNLSLSLDYKAAFFGGMPFELKTRESAFLETFELVERDILFHGLKAGISYSF